MSVNTISKYGDQLMMKMVAERTISGDFYDDMLTFTSDAASVFIDNDNLTSVNMPNIKPQGGALSPPSVRDCDSVTAVYYASHTGRAPQGLFQGCIRVKKVTDENLPLISQLSGETFKGCTALVNVELPSVTDGIFPFNAAFQNCTALRRVCFPNINLSNGAYSLYGGRYAGLESFTNCTALEIFRTPRQAYVVCNYRLFDTATEYSNLKLIDFGSTPKIDQNANYGVRYTKILILRKSDAIATLSSSANFSTTTTPTPIKVYVPSALIELYKTGTNWSTLFANGYVEFVALEGSRFEDLDFDDTEIYNTSRNNLDALL